MKSPVFVGYVVSSVYVQEKYRTVFFMKSPVFVGNVVSSVDVQEKYRTSGIFMKSPAFVGYVVSGAHFFEKYRMSGICWVCGVWCVCAGKVPYVRYFFMKSNVRPVFVR